MRIIKYNSQRNNIEKNGLNAFSQCFSTSNWMRMSFYTSSIMVDDDIMLGGYVAYIESVIGKNLNPETEHPSLLFDVQQAGVTEWLNDRGVAGKDMCDLLFPFDNLIKGLEYCPVTIGTKKIGGLPGGHIILLVDYEVETDSFVVNDPFGNAMTNYKDHNGDSVRYPVTYLHEFATDANGKCRVLWFNKK